MRHTVPKNKNVPIYVIIVVIFLIALYIYVSYINRVVMESYEETVNHYNVLSEKTTTVIRSKIEDSYKSLEEVAIWIGEQKETKPKELFTSLADIIKIVNYTDMVVINNEGHGEDVSGSIIDMSMVPTANISKREGMISSTNSWKGIDGKFLIFSMPICKEGNSVGYIIMVQDTKDLLIDNSSLSYEYENQITTYLVDKSKSIISFDPNNTSNEYNYNSIIGNMNSKSNLNLVEYLRLASINNNRIIWNEKPLGFNDWTVFVGRSYKIDPITINIIQVAKILLIIICGFIVLISVSLIVHHVRSNKKVMEIIYLDPVTEGKNWYKFREDVRKTLNSKNFYKYKYALVNFDINRFKLINDSYGHQKGDEVLKDIYQVIRKWAKPTEMFTRYAADQFYIMLSYQEEEEVEQRILDLNVRLHQLKYTTAGKFYFGVYFITEKKDSIDRMGEFACNEKNSIKGSSESFISYFDDSTREKLLKEEHIEKTMFDALSNQEFIVYLQPKYSTKEETVAGAEALVRWVDKDGNLIYPSLFIPLFEKNGFIMELDIYMLRKVCQIQKEWIAKGYHTIPISVNISRLHFANPHLADTIKEIVDEYQIPHSLIELELTESAFLQNKKMLISTVMCLREYGFIISMDDFGAGYSSLNSLKDIPLDVLKLDGELFRITDEISRGQTVVRNTISMAKDLHMQVVAECIETREQVDFLSSVGCDIIQGYYYAKPMIWEQFEVKYLYG